MKPEGGGNEGNPQICGSAVGRFDSLERCGADETICPLVASAVRVDGRGRAGPDRVSDPPGPGTGTAQTRRGWDAGRGLATPPRHGEGQGEVRNRFSI